MSVGDVFKHLVVQHVPLFEWNMGCNHDSSSLARLVPLHTIRFTAGSDELLENDVDYFVPAGLQPVRNLMENATNTSFATFSPTSSSGPSQIPTSSSAPSSSPTAFPTITPRNLFTLLYEMIGECAGCVPRIAHSSIKLQS
jgi:hypothetical protein